MTDIRQSARIDRSQATYLVVALLIVIATLGTFLLSRPVDQPVVPHTRLSGMVRFIPFLPVLLSWAGLALLLGVAQPWSGLSWLRMPVSLLFAVSTLIYGLAGYRLLWNSSLAVGHSLWQPRATGMAGIGMWLAVAANGAGVLMAREGTIVRALDSAKEKGSFMASGKSYFAIGFGLILIALAHMLFQALASAWQPAPALDWLYLGIFAHPICVTLGGLAVMLGGLQPYLRFAARTSLILSAAYGLGAALFCLALYSAKGRGWPFALDVATVSGLSILTLVIAINLVGILTIRNSIGPGSNSIGPGSDL